MFSQLLTTVIRGHNLTESESASVLTDLLEGKISDIQASALLSALAAKGESVHEITGFAKIMRQKAIQITPKVSPLIDTCGTGGDYTGTFNISTAAAIVASAAGVPVAKHGNRAVSSLAGSAQVLEELGVNINILPERVGECIEKIGIGFLFAPLFHPTMRQVAHIRQELGVRTIFNILGPISNPALSEYQLIGVFDPNLTSVMSGVLKNLGSKRAMIVHGEDSMDEITITGKTKVSELNNGEIKEYHIEPCNFGLKTASIDEVKGGDAKVNAEIIINILENKETGPKRDIVLLNAAASLVIGGKTDDFTSGANMALHVIENGKARKKLEELINFTNKIEF